MKTKLEIQPYVTSSGGIVILNGPFRLDKAEKIAQLCLTASEMLEALKKIKDKVIRAGFEKTCLDDTGINEAIAKAESKWRGLTMNEGD